MIGGKRTQKLILQRGRLHDQALGCFSSITSMYEMAAIARGRIYDNGPPTITLNRTGCGLATTPD
jgi:hypothetical protein